VYTHSTTSLDKGGKKIIYTFVPHGLFPFALALASGVLFKNENIPIAVSSNLFYVPVFGLLLRLLGCVPVNCDAFKTQKSLVLVPDGIAGAFYSDRQHERVFLRNRKGFVREAISNGYDIVPVYCFGHTQLYDVYGFRELSRRLRFAFIFYWGPWGWLPHARPISIVFGPRVLQRHRASNTETTDVDLLHNTYLACLKELYDKYKEIVPEWDRDKELEFI
jgi:2-acylglycerol O-acyltransferase 2